MQLTWQTGTVIRTVDETPNTRRFWIEISDTPSFNFKPGQFITLDLPIHEQKNKRWRSYSIASWPNSTNVLELVIVLLEGGAGTTYLFNQVTVGSKLTLRGPQGVFCLPESIDNDLYFICTGTGIAPFRSMVNHILKNNIPHKDIYLIFGCRKFNDALYAAEIKELAEKNPSFHYIPTFSRETPGDHKARIGYVHQVYEEIIATKKEAMGQSLPAANFYLCGWKNMIDEARRRVTELGYDKKALHFELYG